MATLQPHPAATSKTTTTTSQLLNRAPTIASYALQDPARPEIELAQVRHRIRLISAWGIDDDAIIAPGSRVLELGCGQGTATTVLAEAVGPAGHVDAVDPGAPDYGAPFTLAEAQVSELSGREIGIGVYCDGFFSFLTFFLSFSKWEGGGEGALSIRCSIVLFPLLYTLLASNLALRLWLGRWDSRTFILGSITHCTELSQLTSKHYLPSNTYPRDPSARASPGTGPRLSNSSTPPLPTMGR